LNAVFNWHHHERHAAGNDSVLTYINMLYPAMQAASVLLFLQLARWVSNC
jgi:hypothetical protein